MLGFVFGLAVTPVNFSDEVLANSRLGRNCADHLKVHDVTARAEQVERACFGDLAAKLRKVERATMTCHQAELEKATPVYCQHFADRQSAVLNWIAIELVDAPKIGSLPPPRTVLRTERRIWLRGPRTIVVPQCRERRSTADCQSRCFPPSTDVNR